MPSVKLLLVEDNPRIQLANKDMLTLLGYEVSIAMNLAEARSHIARDMPDAIVLDIMLPDGSGLDFLFELRQVSNVPVLMLTALGTAEDTVAGLSTGADDYLAKPYEYSVLAARVEALLRRARQVPETLTAGPLRFDILGNQAFLSGVDLLLTKKEFSVLLLLVRHKGRALTAEYLYETVWKQPLAEDNTALKNIISRLRRKLSNGYAIRYNAEQEGYVLHVLDGAWQSR